MSVRPERESRVQIVPPPSFAAEEEVDVEEEAFEGFMSRFWLVVGFWTGVDEGEMKISSNPDEEAWGETMFQEEGGWIELDARFPGLEEEGLLKSAKGSNLGWGKEEELSSGLQFPSETPPEPLKDWSSFGNLQSMNLPFEVKATKPPFQIFESITPVSVASWPKLYEM